MRKIFTTTALGLVGIASIGGIAGAAQAHAQSAVNIYGVVDEYLDFSNNAKRVQSGGLAGSRIGFQGSENLGSGLKALFLLEAGIDADTGGSGQGGIAVGTAEFRVMSEVD